MGPNYNGAAFNPKTGELLIANWQTAGSASALIRVSVASPVPTYVGVINLSTPIVAQSGDFAIDATGTYAYGIATGARGASNTSYRIDLASGQLTPLMTGVGESIFGLVWRHTVAPRVSKADNWHSLADFRPRHRVFV